MIQARIAELEEQVAALRAQLGAEQAGARIYRLISAGFTPTMARVAVALWDRGGRLFSIETYDLVAPASERGECRSADSFKVLICGLRKLLGPGSIETVKGSGYRLCAPGRARLSELLGEVP